MLTELGEYDEHVKGLVNTDDLNAVAARLMTPSPFLGRSLFSSKTCHHAPRQAYGLLAFNPAGGHGTYTGRDSIGQQRRQSNEYGGGASETYVATAENASFTLPQSHQHEHREEEAMSG
uniref:Uncharacterized protein n=1 Tax=Haptolina brevifila TaxID=156173 RepID=A0A7S2NJH8_9EUKA|mmetsp:Transcript_79794/g.158565  ORF Transcript_79794/g.158565 Transcript_79794/m.158565 type:complete len:119 (+) Transcript_79794:156-512(+)